MASNFKVKGTSPGLKASSVKTPGSKTTPSVTAGFSKQKVGK